MVAWNSTSMAEEKLVSVNRLAPLFLLAVFSCSEKTTLVEAAEILTVEPSALDFGVVLVGERATRRIALENRSTVPFSVLAPEVASDFEVRPAAVRLEPWQRATFEIVFHPRDLGRQEEVLAFRSTSSEASASVLVSGTGARRAVTVDKQLDFGDVRVGEWTELPLTFTSETDARLEVSLHHTDRLSFSVDRDEFSIEPRATKTVNVRFAPRERRTATDPLTVRLCGDCPISQVELSGRGVDKRLIAVPAAVDFGRIARGLTRRWSVVLENQGDLDIQLDRIAVEGAGFAVKARTLARILPAGEAQSIEVSFTPQEEGTSLGSMQVYDTSGGSLVRIPLRGATGGPLLVAIPAELDLGSAVVGFGNTSSSFRIENVGEPAEGEEELRILGLEIFGRDADAFSPILMGPADISSGVSIDVSFEPIHAGEHSAEVVVRTSSAEQPEIGVSLLGEGLIGGDCRLRYSYASSDGTKEATWLYFENIGTEDCLLWDFKMAGRDADFFRVDLIPAGPVLVFPGVNPKLVMTHLIQEAITSQIYYAAIYFRASPTGELRSTEFTGYRLPPRP